MNVVGENLLVFGWRNKISFEFFDNVKEKVNATNGLCEKEYFFTPDNKNCYKCNDRLVWMAGCNGGCSYSLKRNKIL